MNFTLLIVKLFGSDLSKIWVKVMIVGMVNESSILAEKKVLTPRLRNITQIVNGKGYIVRWFRFTVQRHFCLCGSTVSFPGIAFRTRTDQVFPTVGSAQGFGNYMVSSHNWFPNTAVLAGIIIPA